MAVTSPIDFVTIQDALHTWFCTQTELTTVWGRQDAPQPRHDYAHLLLGPIVDITPREQRCSMVAGLPAGAEVLLTSCQQHQMTVTCTIHVNRDHSTDPRKHARALMHAAKASLGLDSVRATLSTAGLSHISTEPVIDVSAVVGPSWIDRTSMDVFFGLTSTTTETTTFVEIVETEGTFTAGTEVFVENETIGP